MFILIVFFVCCSLCEYVDNNETRVSVSDHVDSADDSSCGIVNYHDCRSLWYAVVKRLNNSGENPIIFVNGSLNLDKGVNVGGINITARDWYYFFSDFGKIYVEPCSLQIGTWDFKLSTVFEFLEFVLRVHLFNETLVKVMSYEDPYYLSGIITFHNVIFRYISLEEKTPLTSFNHVEVLFDNVSIFGGGVIFKVQPPNFPLLNPMPNSSAIHLFKCNGTFQSCIFVNISSWAIHLSESSIKFLEENNFTNNAIVASELYPSLRHNI
jgi:hypothetical protein